MSGMEKRSLALSIAIEMVDVSPGLMVTELGSKCSWPAPVAGGGAVAVIAVAADGATAPLDAVVTPAPVCAAPGPGVVGCSDAPGPLRYTRTFVSDPAAIARRFSAVMLGRRNMCGVNTIKTSESVNSFLLSENRYLTKGICPKPGHPLLMIDSSASTHTPPTRAP